VIDCYNTRYLSNSDAMFTVEHMHYVSDYHHIIFCNLNGNVPPACIFNPWLNVGVEWIAQTRMLNLAATLTVASHRLGDHSTLKRRYHGRQRRANRI
jgi:hypothetical protein